jgi:glutathione S-transferase
MIAQFDLRIHSAVLEAIQAGLTAIGKLFDLLRCRVSRFRLFWRFSNSLKLTRGEFPNLYAHYDRMMARPAVQRTLEIEASIADEPAA